MKFEKIQLFKFFICLNHFFRRLAKMSTTGISYRDRMYNYDLLRIISAIAVIMIHVSASYFDITLDAVIKSGMSIGELQSPFSICVYNSISRFAVPCFVMLSGALILNDERTLNYREFYKRSFDKIGVPTIVFSVLYILFRTPFYLIWEDSGIKNLVISVITGSPMNHMWYLYMIIGVYVMAPVVLRFKNSISEQTFYKLSFVFLILAFASRWTTAGIRLSWDIGQSFEYLGYFMTGYTIRKIGYEKNNRKAAVMILVGLLFELCAAGLKYMQIMQGIAESELKYQIVSPYSPFIVPASVLIFWGFTKLNVTADMSKLSCITFYIYLIHAGVWAVIDKSFLLIKGKNFLTSLDGAVWILVFVAIVFVISCVFSRIYLWIWDKADKEKRITKYLERALRLTESSQKKRV